MDADFFGDTASLIIIVKMVRCTFSDLNDRHRSLARIAQTLALARYLIVACLIGAERLNGDERVASCDLCTLNELDC